MVQTPWRLPPLTKEQENRLFMLLLKDDTEDAPWMVMGDLQFWSASSFAQSLRTYAHEHNLAWYVAAMLPITFRWPGVASKRTLAPDTFVSFVSERARTSYDPDAEGMFPPFVLEVVSPSSTSRDHEEKLYAYDALGVREYVLFTPWESGGSTLEGYRRGADSASGAFEPWPRDERERLWSDVLGLYLAVYGTFVQAETREGRVLLTPEQEAVERRRETDVRLRAEEEVERLRRELERLRHKGDQSGQSDQSVE